jgi:hypothetical protein
VGPPVASLPISTLKVTRAARDGTQSSAAAERWCKAISALMLPAQTRRTSFVGESTHHVAVKQPQVRENGTQEAQARVLARKLQVGDESSSRRPIAHIILLIQQRQFVVRIVAAKRSIAALLREQSERSHAVLPAIIVSLQSFQNLSRSSAPRSISSATKLRAIAA